VLEYSRLGIGFCWIAFLIAWAVGAMAYRGGSGRSSSTRLALVVRVAFVASMYAAVYFSLNSDLQPFGAQVERVALAGVAICAIGVAFAIWARLALGRSWGMPMTQHANPELVTSGPYAYVRHPIYTGLATMFIGTSLVYPVAALSSVLMIAYMVFSALREERDMAQRFPDHYPAYRQRSKMLVPFVL
jgi:protein-S-isoprenylcysteine O-methyltransferase Ste14